LMGGNFELSRYEQLADYLEGLVGDRAVLSFSEVERLIGSPLPASARKLRTWWSNDATHSQARRGWLSAGVAGYRRGHGGWGCRVHA
jgi:hypothetical protein